MNWIQKHFKTIIYISFLVPILTVAFVSISHVTSWYGLTNPMSWAVYLSVGIEIAALSALAAISAKMGSKVYFPFGVVTLIQFIGNIFFAYQYIDVTSNSFKDWVDLVDPLVVYLGVDSEDVIGHKRILSLFSGGMLPIISLTFLHMLVKFEEEDKVDREIIVDVKPKKKKTKTKPIKIDEVAQPKSTDTEIDQYVEEYVKSNEERFKNIESRSSDNVDSDSNSITDDGIKRLNYLRRDA